MKELEVESHVHIATTKLKSKEEEKKYNKYKGIVKPFCQGDSISAWPENIEFQLMFQEIPKEHWAMIYMKYLSGEPLKVIESIPQELGNDYDYIHQRIMQHFLLDAPGYQVQFSKLKPKNNKTFIYYVTHVQDVYNKWLNAAKINKNYKKLRDLMIMDKIISTTPSPFAKFLQQADAESLEQLEKRGSAFFSSNRDIFNTNIEESAIVAAANSKPQKPFTFREKQTPYPPQCPYCIFFHDQFGMCDANPNYPSHLEMIIKKQQNKRETYRRAVKCYFCHFYRHYSSRCRGRQRLRAVNAALVDSSSESESEQELIQESGENVVAAIGVLNYDRCSTCHTFHKDGVLECGHRIPITNENANAVMSDMGKLTFHQGIVNHKPCQFFLDSGYKLIGLRKELANEEDYTGEFVNCRTFSGNVEKYPLARARIRTPFLTGTFKCAILDNPCTDLIIGCLPDVKHCTQKEISAWQKRYMKRKPAAEAEARSNIHASGCTGQLLYLSCQPQQKIAIKRVFYGVKKDSDCRFDTGGYRNPSDQGTRDFHVKVNNSECCRTSHTDCQLDEDTMYPTLNTKCSGYPSCNLDVQKILTRDPCRYKPYTDYMTIVYDCVSAGDIASFCSDDVKRGKSLYLANQEYPAAISARSQSYQCQCIIRTSHPQGIGIHTIDVLLAWSGPIECRRNLRIQDPMTYQRDIQCAKKGYYGFKSIYSRPVSNVTITLSSQPGNGMAFVWLQAKPNDADGFVEILCGQSLQNLLNRIRHQAESRQREQDAKKIQQEKTQGKNEATDKPEDDENKAANVTVATAATKSRTLNSDLAAIVGGVVAAGFMMISIVIIAMACHCHRTRKEDRQLKALELQPALTPEPLDMTSYCRYDYDDDHVCSISRSPVKMSALADPVGSSFRPNGFTTIAHAEKCQIHRDLSSSALLPPGISTPPPASQNRLLLGGRSFREVHYPGDMSLRFVKPLMNISKSFTSSATDCSEHYPQGHTTLPANRKAVLVSCGPKSPLGKRSKSVTFSQPVAMVTPLNSESEESVEKSVLSVEVDDPSYDNLNKLDIPDYPIIPGKSDLIKFSKWDKEIREDSPIRSKSMSTFHNPITSTPETKVFVAPTCDLRVNFDHDDLAYMSDSPSTFWSPPKRNGKPLVLPKPQKAELYETGV